MRLSFDLGTRHKGIERREYRKWFKVVRMAVSATYNHIRVPIGQFWRKFS
jgi:hypothetical protein